MQYKLIEGSVKDDRGVRAQSEQKRLRFVLLEAVVLCRENAYEYQRESYDVVRNVIDKNRGQGEK